MVAKTHDIIASDESALRGLVPNSPVFVCVISYTATSEISGLTIAGANPEMIKYTSPADSEFLYYGSCKCIDAIPATPDGKPTPALITRAALQAAQIPAIIVDAGAAIKPSIPHFSFGLAPGRNIAIEDAMEKLLVHRAFSFGELLGKQLAMVSDLVVIGESIPGGTTTALAVLSSLGIDAKFKVSSSMPENPHVLKNKIVSLAMQRSGGKRLPFEAIASVGDPMMPTVAGIASGALSQKSKVLLAGGTQMAAIVAILKNLDKPLDGLFIGTTTYITNDPSADLNGLVRAVSRRVPILSCDLHFEKSVKPGLRAFSKGFVKEGVGAGGASIAAILKSKGRITGRTLLRKIEKEYEASIEIGS